MEQYVGVSVASVGFEPYAASPTTVGRAWGLTRRVRGSYPLSFSAVSTVLAADESGKASAWVQVYRPDRPGSGFVQLWGLGADAERLPMIRAVAEYGLLRAAATAARDSQPARFPAAVVAESDKLEFHVVSAPWRGALPAQMRAALHELFQRSEGARIAKLRVFAGAQDDLSTVQQIVADTFRARKLPLPALSVLGVAAFPDQGQRVSLEAVAVAGRPLNQHGLAFLAGLATPAGDRTIGGLARVARAAGVPTSNVLRISCFYESPEQLALVKRAVADTFPRAEVSFVLAHVADAARLVECEAVARLATPASEAVSHFNVPGTQPSPNYSHATLVSAPRLVLTGAQMAMGDSPADLRSAFDSLKQAVETLGGKLSDVLMANNYFVKLSARDALRAVRPEYFGTENVPAATGVVFSGLPSPRAAAAIELVVVAR
jgi:enamine deaminase RidA (YjgF/YER057c/UK114 family)